jgi:hypothetical protein
LILRLVVVGVILRISIFLPTFFPLLQPYCGAQADRVGIVKLTELARAVLEARLMRGYHGDANMMLFYCW